MGLLRVATLLLVICFSEVWSLKCYSCFSYVNHTDCENRYNLKEIECPDSKDTCIKFSMMVTIQENYGIGSGNVMKTNKAFGRDCGTKAQCQSDSICKSKYDKKIATVNKCRIECCDADLKAECHKRPGWPGTKKSGSIITYTDIVDNQIYKGQRGTGARLTTTTWSLLPVCLLALV